MKYEDLGPNEQMASLRTSLSIQRTRMAAERTLMASLRTSLSLIGFGFTIFSFFQSLASRVASPVLPPVTGFSSLRAPARFGLALVFVGVVVLILGATHQYMYMKQLRSQRADFIRRGFLPGTSSFPVSYSLIAVFLLALIGLAAILSIMVRVGPFS